MRIQCPLFLNSRKGRSKNPGRLQIAGLREKMQKFREVWNLSPYTIENFIRRIASLRRTSMYSVICPFVEIFAIFIGLFLPLFTEFCFFFSYLVFFFRLPAFKMVFRLLRNCIPQGAQNAASTPLIAKDPRPLLRERESICKINSMYLGFTNSREKLAKFREKSFVLLQFHRSP